MLPLLIFKINEILHQPVIQQLHIMFGDDVQNFDPFLPSSPLPINPRADIITLECPITREEINDPVLAPDGYMYERAAIVEWLKRTQISPMTREPMEIGQLISFTHNKMRQVMKEAEKYRRIASNNHRWQSMIDSGQIFAYAESDSEAHAETDSDAHAETDALAHTDALAETDAHANAYADDEYPDTDSDSDADADAYTDPDTDLDEDAEAEAEAKAEQNSLYVNNRALFINIMLILTKMWVRM